MHFSSPYVLVSISLSLLAACGLKPGNGADTDSPSSTGGGAACEDVGQFGPKWPWPEDVGFPLGLGFVDIDEPCTLTAAQQTDSGLEFSLDCPKWAQDSGKDAFQFTILSGAVPAVPELGSVLDVFAHREVADIGEDIADVIVRHEGALLYASIYDKHLVPLEASGPEIFAPLALSRTDHCPLVAGHPGGDQSGDSFLCDLVGRARLHVATEGAEALELADDEAGSVSGDAGTYEIDVKRAWRLMDCQPDYPPGELEMMAFTAARQ